MQLKEYRKWRELTLADIASRVDLKVYEVSRHEHGRRKVNAELRERYRVATEGFVTPQDWHELELLAAKSATVKEH